jgi:hypothetical protein
MAVSASGMPLKSSSDQAAQGIKAMVNPYHSQYMRFESSPHHSFG